MRTNLGCRVLLSIAIALAACFAAGCGDDGPANPGGGGSPATLSAAWGGIWEIRFTFRDCTTDSIYMEAAVVDSFCAGGNAATELGFADFGFIQCPDVSVSTSGNTVSASCSITGMDGTCTVTQQFAVSGTASSGGTLTGNGQIAVTVSPHDSVCGEDQCFNIEVNGDRLSTDQPGCTTKTSLGERVGALLRAHR